MKKVNLFVHFFFPHESNNQKARILHSRSITALAVLLIVFQLVLNFTSHTFPSVLGYAANISPSEVVRLTNEKRAQNGLTPVIENSALSSAALAKGQDMLAKGYWAHFAPDGTSPWSFFTRFGYKYKYAGENLARDFSSASSTVDGWMNSPTHRDNILNANYKDIGIGVVEGALAGTDTTIVVQFFGATNGSIATIPVAKAQEVKISPKPTLKPSPASTVAPTLIPTPSPTPTFTPSPTSIANSSSTTFISPFESTKDLSLGITGLLLLVLSIDLVVVRRKRIARIGGRTLAHLAFFGMILAVILILKAGRIL